MYFSTTSSLTSSSTSPSPSTTAYFPSTSTFSTSFNLFVFFFHYFISFYFFNYFLFSFFFSSRRTLLGLSRTLAASLWSSETSTTWLPLALPSLCSLHLLHSVLHPLLLPQRWSSRASLKAQNLQWDATSSVEMGRRAPECQRRQTTRSVTANTTNKIIGQKVRLFSDRWLCAAGCRGLIIYQPQPQCGAMWKI